MATNGNQRGMMNLFVPIGSFFILFVVSLHFATPTHTLYIKKVEGYACSQYIIREKQYFQKKIVNIKT